jgi:hypothetical protein
MEKCDKRNRPQCHTRAAIIQAVKPAQTARVIPGALGHRRKDPGLRRDDNGLAGRTASHSFTAALSVGLV